MLGFDNKYRAECEETFEILACDNFKTLYEAVRITARMEGTKPWLFYRNNEYTPFAKWEGRFARV